MMTTSATVIIGTKWNQSYRFVVEGLPGEEQVVDVGRNGHDEVECVLVDDALTHVVKLGGKTCQNIHNI